MENYQHLSESVVDESGIFGYKAQVTLLEGKSIGETSRTRTRIRRHKKNESSCEYSGSG